MLCCASADGDRISDGHHPHESPQELNYRRQTVSGREDERTNLCEYFADGLGVPAGRTSRHTTFNEEESGVRVVRAISNGNHDPCTNRASRMYILVKESCSSEARRYLQGLLKYDQNRTETTTMQTKVSMVEYSPRCQERLTGLNGRRKNDSGDLR